MSANMQPNSHRLDLTEFEDDYVEVPVQEQSEREELPDGKYQVVVDKVELTTTKTSGAPILKWALKVLGGPHAGRRLFRHNLIGSKDNLKWLKTDLHTCGLVLAKLSELPDRLGELLDVKLEVTKKTNGEFTNVYINKRIVLMEDLPQAADPSIPF
jgi:hypothetical protein